MIFYPKSYFKNILEIDMNFIEKNNIKAILLDIDNTMIDTDNNILEGLEDWVEEAKKHGIKFCILSNTNKKKKAEKMSKKLEVPYIYFAKKPFNKIASITNNEGIVVISSIVDKATFLKVYAIAGIFPAIAFWLAVTKQQLNIAIFNIIFLFIFSPH